MPYNKLKIANCLYRRPYRLVQYCGCSRSSLFRTLLVRWRLRGTGTGGRCRNSSKGTRWAAGYNSSTCIDILCEHLRLLIVQFSLIAPNFLWISFYRFGPFLVHSPRHCFFGKTLGYFKDEGQLCRFISLFLSFHRHF